MIVKPRTRRENNGYALIAVLSIGAFASIFLLSLVAMTDSLIRSDSMQKQKAVLLDAAETGLDFAINDLNMGIMHVTEGSTVDPTVEEAFKETQLPADYLPDPSQNLTVKIRVSRLDNTTIESIKAQSYLYNPSKDESGYFYNENPRRLIEVTAKNGLISTSIRAFASWNPFLAPNAPPPKAGVTEPNTPFFPSPLLANSLLTFNDTSEGDSAGTSVDVQAEAEERPVINPANQIQGNSFKLNVQSNGETKLGTNAKIWGDLTITNPVDGAPSSIANANSPTNSTLVGKLRSNTAVDRLDPSTNPTGTLVATDGPNPNYHTDNVQAAAELITYEPESGDPPQRTGENLTPIGTNDSPQASGKSPPAPSPSGAPSLPASSSSLEGGSYSTYFLKAIDSDSSIETSETPGVRQIFITDDFFSEQVRPTNSDTTAVDIKSSNFVNHTGDAKNLQLFYDGTRNININLDGGIPFSGLIYAPNAKVSLTGTGDFIGAMVGSRVFINNTGGVRLLHDIGSDLTAPTSKDLTDPTFVGEPAGPNQLSSSYSTGGGPYKIDSWQQVNTILVP